MIDFLCKIACTLYIVIWLIYFYKLYRYILSLSINNRICAIARLLKSKIFTIVRWYLKPNILLKYILRPYPFQLWIAPRSTVYQSLFSKGKRGAKWPSPPGFGENYAMFLYPDNLHTWWIFFFSGCCFVPNTLKIIIDIIYKNESHHHRFYYECLCQVFHVTKPNLTEYIASFLFGAIFFIAAYRVINIWLRRPVLDELWPAWPQIRGQKEYFRKYVPARISEERKKICCCLKNKVTTKYFYRPVFFNPGRSLQEGLLRTAIASFIAEDEKRPLINIMLLIFYFLAPVWVSFLYLLLKLMIIFVHGNPGAEKSTTVFLIVEIVIWAILSILFLFRQFLFIKNLSIIDSKLFSLVTAKIGVKMEEKIQVNKETIEYLNPKITIPVVSAFTFIVYLALLNLVLQYDTQPSVSYTGQISIHEKVNSSAVADKDQNLEMVGTICIKEEENKLQCPK